MLFVITEERNGERVAVEYPVSREQVDSRYIKPNANVVGFDMTYLSSIGVYPVKPTDAPGVDVTMKVVAVTPMLIAGEWVETYEIVAKTQEELANDMIVWSQSMRDQRDALLRMSDWTQLADAPLTAETKQSWVEYRQLLRDIPSQSGFPFNVTWPTTP